MHMPRRYAILLTLLCLTLLSAPAALCESSFRAGYAEVDVTPEKPTPMWGYGDRHALLSKDTRDPLMARALVLEADKTRIAIVGMDLGRAPTSWMMPVIREAVKEASAIDAVMIAGSHTHHGPVIELQDEEGKGKGVYDDAVAYAKQLEGKLIDVINAAAADLEDAKIGWGSTEVTLNRNRHTKKEPKPVDRELGVIRIDSAKGKPKVILVNFAAHPTNIPASDLRFSWEYPGFLAKTIKEELGADCVFMQGASGDLSTNREGKTYDLYGESLGLEAINVAQAIETAVPEKPSIQVTEDAFEFESRLDLTNPLIRGVFQQAFFPELLSALDELDGNTLHAPMTTALINGQLAIVTGPGEFFCAHSMRLKERSQAEKTFFFGYCNGHNMYYPTIEATAEGGYGADATVAWVELGAGERMMNKALININTMLGKYPSIMEMLMKAGA